MKKITNKGITLVALVVTIIVLMILSSISIGAILSEKGIIQQAKDSKKQHEDAVRKEEENLNELLGEYKNSMNGEGFGNGTVGGETTTPATTPTPSVPKGPNGNQLVTSITEKEHGTIEAEDIKGNKVVVPGGFKMAEDSGSTVEEGIVVEDDIGNQFVWIPVSNINHDGSNKIKKNDGTEVEITLGRYSYNSSTGALAGSQYAINYENPTKYGNSKELIISRISSSSSENTTAKDLAGFINSVRVNNGFLFGRYEASYRSGKKVGVGTNEEYYKPASIKSRAYNETSMSYVEGTLWNWITQSDAALVSRQMYNGNDYVESDLVNSYMWDTAAVYIRSMGYTNYVIQGKYSSTLNNTGLTVDQKCHIYDMAGNNQEWTTEYSSWSNSLGVYPCTLRGGCYWNSGGTYYVIGRDENKTTDNTGQISTGKTYSYGFRVGAWIK